MSSLIVEYIKSLIPQVDKDQIIEDLRVTETELQETVIPAYADAAAFFSKDKFKSRENEKIDREVRSLLKARSRSATFITDFHVMLEAVLRNIEVVTKLVNQEMGRDVVTDGISSRKVTLMRASEHMSYVSRFALDLLNLVYLNEASELGTDTREIGLSPAEMARAKGCISNLTRLLESYSIDPKDFEKKIDHAPDIVIGKTDNDDVEALYTDSDLDPISSPMVSGFVGNPIYHVRMVVAEWQAKRYKASQDKKKVLELRLLHLNLLKSQNGSNPNLEKQIAYNQQRVAKIDRYLAEVEADLEIAA